MADTVKVKHTNENGDDHMIINRADFDPAVHELYDEEDDVTSSLTDEEREALRKKEIERTAEGNRGVPGSISAEAGGKNPSGTYSEPTPTDIRYPNKDATEFENNHGAFVRKSAAQIREDEGMEDKPGGLIPEVHEAVQEATVAAATAADAATEAQANAGQDDEASTDLDSMTVPQLKQYAADHQIELDGATTKADIRAAIDKASK